MISSAFMSVIILERWWTKSYQVKEKQWSTCTYIFVYSLKADADPCTCTLDTCR